MSGVNEDSVHANQTYDLRLTCFVGGVKA